MVSDPRAAIPSAALSRPVVLFPGLGAQHPGMGADLAARFPRARECFRRASDVLGFDLGRILFEGPGERLEEELVAQAAVFTTSLAAFSALEDAAGVRPGAVAGHSLGLYTAYAAAGILSLEDALRALVRAWELMTECAPPFECAMGVVEGLDAAAVESLVEGEDRVWIANRNAWNHHVVSGARSSVDRLLERAKAAGAYSAKSLPTRLAVHSPLLGEASARFGEWLAGLPMNDPVCPVADTLVAGRIETGARARAVLGGLLCRPVLWEATMLELRAEGFHAFVETGPKKGLKGLLRRILPDCTCRHAADLLKGEAGREA